MSDQLDMSLYPALDVHGILPWSVLRGDSTQWQARKKHWTNLVDDLAGREQVEIFRHGKSGRHHRISGGKSRFDGFLAELAYIWYAPPQAHVIDPFAGGPTRGIVAAHLGRNYTGIDLSHPQVEANRAQSQHHLSGAATWIHADAAEHLSTLDSGTYDYALTCPPYHNLEKYTDDPRDLSVMTWEQHLDTLRTVTRQLYRVLQDHTFATWVTSDLRDPRGHLRCLPEHTITALRDAGFGVINDQILVKPVGSMHRMLRRWWTNTRSAGRVHQRVITVVKGDRRKATAAVKGEAVV